MSNTREYIVLHHTADKTQGPQFDKVNRSHKARGFPISSLGYYVGYHYFIGYEGTVKIARREDETGAHCAAKLMNYKGIGICLAGDFTQHKPNPRQIESLAALVKDIQYRNKIDDNHVLHHGNVKPTACPGTDLKKLIKEQGPLVQSASVLMERLRDTYQEYQKATTPAQKNRLQRIMDRIERALISLQ